MKLTNENDFLWNILLEITDLHNRMILSTLSISSRGFPSGFPKRPHTTEDVFLLINSWSFPKLAKVGLLPNNPQQSSPRTQYTIEPPLNWGSTPSLEPSNKVHYLLDNLVTFDYTFEAHDSLFDIWGFYWHG